MKKQFIFIIFASLFIFQNVSAQEASGLYVETTKFGKYEAKGKIVKKITNKYDKQGKLIRLSFESFKDSTLTIGVYDYDSNGKKNGYTELVFIKDRERKSRYLLIGKYDLDKFKMVIQKIVDRIG